MKQKCWSIILKEVKRAYEEGGIYMSVLGKDILVLPMVPFIQQDNVEGAALCCLALSYQAQRPCRFCWVSNENCANPKASADRRLESEMSAYRRKAFDEHNSGGTTKSELESKLSVVSSRNVRTGFKGVPFGSPYGIYGACPVEVLHHFDLGVCNKIWSFILALMKDESNRKVTLSSYKKKMEILDERLSSFRVRHCVQDLPKERFYLHKDTYRVHIKYIVIHNFYIYFHILSGFQMVPQRYRICERMSILH